MPNIHKSLQLLIIFDISVTCLLGAVLRVLGEFNFYHCRMFDVSLLVEKNKTKIHACVLSKW